MKWSMWEFRDRLLALLLLPAFVFCAAWLPRSRRNAWLIGENVGHPHKDNGYCFFRYCQVEEYRHVYFVAGREAVNEDPFLQKSDRVLIYGTIRHLRLLSLSSTFLYTHTVRDIVYRRLLPLVSRGKKRVFLDHGVTGFKKFHRDYQTARNDMDIFVAVSKFEESIIANCIGTDAHRIRVTGFPRFDYLRNRAQPETALQILYFLTWRDWISPEQIEASAFVREVKAVLSDPRLEEILVSHDIVLKVCPHTRLPVGHGALSDISPRIHFTTFGEENVQELLARSHLLITDYSSISWDFFYLGKPVLFYHFDLDDYLRERGSYVDLRTPPFGARAETRDEFFELLTDCINRGFVVSESDQQASAVLFSFHDRENCRRVYEATRELQHAH